MRITLPITALHAMVPNWRLSMLSGSSPTTNSSRPSGETDWTRFIIRPYVGCRNTTTSPARQRCSHQPVLSTRTKSPLRRKGDRLSPVTFIIANKIYLRKNWIDQLERRVVGRFCAPSGNIFRRPENFSELIDRLNQVQRRLAIHALAALGAQLHDRMH